MTTIAYRDGIMCADGQAYGGKNNLFSPGEKQKIWRLPSGALVGVSANVVGTSEAIKDWLEAGASPLDLPTGVDRYEALLVMPSGEVYLYRDSPWPSGPISAPYHAIGSGDEMALGAMAVGADAWQAVEAASRHDVWTGRPSHTLTLRPRRRR